METTNANFGRPFQIWSYVVEHRQLLLRSTTRDGFPTRVNVLFKNVSGFHLLTSLKDLSVSIATDEERAGLRLEIDPFKLKRTKVFVVRSSGFVGYVAADTLAWPEDALEYYDPGHFASSVSPGSQDR